jgi:hypothetical protein
MLNEYCNFDRAMLPCSSNERLDWLIALIWPLLLIIGYIIADLYLFHWFVIPIYFCGVLMSIDAIHWIRGKMDTFDPRGLVGLFGCNFFVLSPILAVYYRVDHVGEVFLDDFRPWMGGMAILNLFGIMTYLIVERKISLKPKTIKKFWSENIARSSLILPLALFIIGLCHIYYTAKGGGISAYMAKKTYGDRGALAGTVGLGPLFVIGRALPIMLLITITAWFRKSGRKAGIVLVGITIFTFLVAQFLIVGFTGSRSSTMWALFWAAGIIHFFWRPIPVKLVIISMVPLLLFLYLYGFYKELGTKTFDLFTGRTSLESLEYETKRTFARVLVGDMGRSDVQAAILSIVTNPNRDYDFYYGKTYLTSAVSMIPRRIWPSKPDDAGKVIAGTDMFYGKGSYQSERSLYVLGKRSTHIYGLAGEAMLNFGVWGVIPAFAVWGYIVGTIRRRILNYSPGDMRLLIVPFWVLISFFLLIQDLDNFVEVSVFNLLIPGFIIWLISFKTYRQDNNVNNLTDQLY